MGDAGAVSATTGFQISWIELAHGAAEEIEDWAANYDDITRDDFESGSTSYISDSKIAV